MSLALALTGSISLAQLLLHRRAPPPPPRPPPWWLPVQPPLPPSAPAPPASPPMWNPTKAGRAASKAWMRALPAWLNRPASGVSQPPRLNRPASGVSQPPPASAPSPPPVLQLCDELQLREITNGWTSTRGCLWPLASGRFGSCLTPGANTGSYSEVRIDVCTRVTRKQRSPAHARVAPHHRSRRRASLLTGSSSSRHAPAPAPVAVLARLRVAVPAKVRGRSNVQHAALTPAVYTLSSHSP